MSTPRHPVSEHPLACDPGQASFLRRQIERRSCRDAAFLRARLTPQLERLEDDRTVVEIKSIKDTILLTTAPAAIALLQETYVEMARLEQTAELREMRDRIDQFLWQIGEVVS